MAGILGGFMDSMNGAGPLGGRATNWLQENPYTAIMLGMGLLSGRDTSDAIGKGMQGLLGGSEYDAGRKTKADQEKALGAYFDANPDVFPTGTKDLIKAFPTQGISTILGSGGTANTSDITEYKYYANQEMKEGRKPVSFKDWQQTNKGASGAQENAYGTPIFRYDEKNNVVGYDLFTNKGTIYHYDSSGKFLSETRVGSSAPSGGAPGSPAVGSPVVPTSAPGGAVPPITPPGSARPPGSVKIGDQGTSLSILTPSGAQVGSLPVDVSGKAAAAAVGGGSGTAQVGLPGVENTVRRVTEELDKLIANPDIDSLVGYYEPIGVAKSSVWAPDTKTRAAQARAKAQIDLVVGNVFLSAYDSLRGAGAITEQEGAAAKAAITKLQSTNLAYKDYIQAAREAKREMEKLLEVAQRKSGLADPAPTSPSAGKTITLPDGTVMRQIN